jgi:fatty-acyl-CoA synthase
VVTNPGVTERRLAIEARHPKWQETTLDAYLDWAGAAFGDRLLVAAEDKSLTYKDVLLQKQRMAAALQAMGVRPGERVGVLMLNHADLVPLLFAIWTIGAIAVPFNTLYRNEELAFALRQSGCNVLIAAYNIFGRDIGAELDAIDAGWRDGKFSELPEMRAVAMFNATSEDRIGFRDKIEQAAAEASPRIIPAAAPHDTAVIMYTSGSTGFPKGVTLTHDGMLRAAYCNAYHHAYPDERRAVFSLPLYHMYGLVEGLLASIVVGGSIVVLTRFNPTSMLAMIEKHRPTWLLAVPTMTIALLEAASSSSYDLSSLEGVHNASAPTPSWAWERIQKTFGVKEISTSYGQTETAMITCTQTGDPMEVVALTQGVTALAGVAGISELGGRIAAIRIVDPVTGEDAPRGASGEIYSKGPTNSSGYFRNPEETAKLFTADGWLKMGDLGRFREDGNLLLVGRSKEIFKSRGELVAPKELEELLTTHPGISQAYVVGVPDDRHGECGCAWIVRANPQLASEDVRQFLEERVARFKVPRDILFIEDHELSKTGTGKVQKHVLRERAVQMACHSDISA